MLIWSKREYYKNIVAYKIGKETMFADTEFEKHKIHQHKSHILVYDVNINKIEASIKFPFGKKGFKYFIGYKDVKKS